MWMSHILAVHSPSLICSPSAPVHNLEAAKVERTVKTKSQNQFSSFIDWRLLSGQAHASWSRMQQPTKCNLHTGTTSHCAIMYLCVAHDCCSPLQLAFFVSVCNLFWYCFLLVTLGASVETIYALITNCAPKLCRATQGLSVS